MGVIIRGAKNTFRNNTRTISIILILMISISMALVMFISFKTVQNKIANVKSSIGNYITITPAGIRGFEGGGELLNQTNINSISGLTNIKHIVLSLSDRLFQDQNTNLASAIEAGSFGNRVRNQEMDGNQESDSNQTPANSNSQRNFSPPIMVTGTNDLSITANLNVSQFNIVSGFKFAANSSSLSAIVGQGLASKNNLKVGSTFQIYNRDIKVIGIFDAGNQFSNASLVMPLKTLQTISDQAGQINSILVEANSIDQVSNLVSQIKTKLGDKADVVSQQDSSQNAIAPLENIKTISLYSLIGAIIAGSIIIFLTIVMIVRERKKEIGVLKAIGASNFMVVSQFAIESMILSLISSVGGIILGLVLANPILKVLINSAELSSSPGAGGGGANMAQIASRGAGQAIRNFGANFIPGAQNVIRDIHAAVGWQIILYGLVAAVIIAILGSILPAFIISKIRPAEVLRSE